MAFQFDGSGGGTFTGPLPPTPNHASTSSRPAPTYNLSGGFRPTPTNNPRASIFTFTPLADSGASNASSATGKDSPPTQAKTAVTASTTKGKPSRKHFKQTVTVLVGTFKQPFTLHKGLLCFYSDFFRAALEGSFKEANEGKVELPDVNVDIFEAFQVWLYTRSLRNIEDHDDSSKPQKLPPFSVLAQLWVFGDKYQVPLLQNDSVDALMEKFEEERTFSTMVVHVAYQSTMEGSMLRKLAMDLCVFRLHHQARKESLFHKATSPELSREALVDFACGVSNAWEQKLTFGVLPLRDKCYYHVHAAGEHC